MNAKKLITFCIAIAMVLAVFLGLGTAAGAQEGGENNASEQQSAAGGAAIQSKDEVVYAKLSPGGAAESVYVVNHFSLGQGGKIEDHGDYQSVVNLTDTGEIGLNGDTVSFTAAEDNFYYQGNLADTDLPWSFDLTYRLNGAQMQPQDLAGRDGKLEIHLSSQQNGNVDPTFYENYMLQITVTLDTGKCGNIDAPGATIASAGSNRTIVYTILPGNDADATLTADVTDFTMTGIQIAGLPYSSPIEMPDTDDSLGELSQLSDAIAQLNDGVAELHDGAAAMEGGAAGLTGGSSEIKSGLAQLSANSGSLKSASGQISGALSNISAALDGASLEDIDLDALSQLPDGLSQLSVGLRNMSDSLSQLSDGFGAAYSALDGAIGTIPQGTLSEAEIAALAGALDVSDPNYAQHAATLAQLSANYEAAQRAKGTYEQVKGAFASVDGTLATLAGGLDGMADSLTATADEIRASLGQLGGLSQLGSLVSGISELAAQYGQFNEGLAAYTDGVSTLAANYKTFDAGLSSFADGVGELQSGIGELHDGTGTLAKETADLPALIQEEIDRMKEDYLPSDFTPVSFTSPENTTTEFVQFVLQTDGIEKQETEEAPEAEAPQETFWDRLTALFTGGE